MLDKQGALDRLHARAGRHSRPPILPYRILLPHFLPSILLCSVSQMLPSQDPSFPTSIVMMIVPMRLFWVRQRATQSTSAEYFILCKENHDIDTPLGQTACDAAQQDDHQDVHGVRVEKMCIGEVAEEDMLRKLFEHEEHGHEKDSGGVVFFSERGTGVCLGATERNGNLENRDREDPRI